LGKKAVYILFPETGSFAVIEACFLIEFEPVKQPEKPKKN
jgi:hypothetical protein